MQLIKLNCGINGALFNEEESREMYVAKDTKAKVVMSGSISSEQKKGDNGYQNVAFGRLPMDAAVVEKDGKKRLVLQIAGGLRGVLFPMTPEDKADFRKRVGDDNAEAPDYNGTIEVGDGSELYLTGVKRKATEGGKSFISIRSGKVKEKKDGNGGNGNKPSPATTQDFDDEDPLPF